MKRDGVSILIGRLSAHHELVSQAYYNGEVTKGDDNARGIEYLQQHKVLIPRSQETYTLHTTLRRFFQASLNIERLYLLGSDIGAAFERIDQLLDSLLAAFHDGRLEDKERLEDETHQSIYEISDALSTDLAQLRALVENRFAAVSTLAEKRRQNAYYIGRTEKIVKAIEGFTLSDRGERVETQAAFSVIAPMFVSQLVNRLPSFRQSLLDILRTLRDYLFEFRSIEERTKRVRAMWLFMERNPLYELKAWDQVQHPPRWLTKASALAIKAYPSVRNPAYTDELGELAQDIAPPAVRVSTTRPRGTLVVEEEETEILEPKPYQKAVLELMESCRASGTPHSALKWFEDHPTNMGAITLPLWLQAVMEQMYRENAGKMGLQVTPVETPFEVFDGNLLVSDVVIAAAP